MHLEILVEEPSAEEALSLLIPKIVGDKASFAIHSFGDKQTLLREIGSRLKAYAQWMPADWRIVILVDRDDDDCQKLKARLELAAKDASLSTKTVASHKNRIRVINRIAIEELEAWFFGDVQALTAAYPKVSLKLIKKAAYRDADRPVRQGSVQYRLTSFRFVPTLGALRAGGHDSLFLVVSINVLNLGPTPVPLNQTTLMLTDEGDRRINRSAAAEAWLQQQAGADTTLFATQCPPNRLVYKKMVFVVAPYLPYWLYRLWLGDNTHGWPPVYVNCYENHREGG